MQPIHLILSAPAETLAPTASHFWGNPLLPPDCTFPTYIDREGDEYPYTFICQLNLADLASFDRDGILPSTGLLLFFAKIDNYLGYDVPMEIGGAISRADAVRVLYLPQFEGLVEHELVDDDGQPVSPAALRIDFALSEPSDALDDHAVFAAPTHREWETWGAPCEDWQILLQIDSFEGEDFTLNFMDCGVLDILISPVDLSERRFDRVRGIVLST